MPPNPSPSTMAIRAVNRMFADTVRSDWKFPPKASNSASGSAQSVPLGSIINPFLDAKDAEPVTYRERYYSTSEDDELGSQFDDSEEEEEETIDEEAEQDVEKDSAVSGEGLKETPKKKKKRESAKFETPDSVAEFVDRRLKAIKKRKRKALEEEAEWNHGLCFFLKRRNAWTGAVSVEEARRRTEEKDFFMLGTPEKEAVSMTGLDLGYTNATRQESISNGVVPNSEVEAKDEKLDSQFDVPEDMSTLTDVLIPIVSPILPDGHPVRANILARSEKELYEKLVRDSRTPAVPINLAHMMRVIVQGWKDEGNWPPKGNLPEPAFAVGRRAKAAIDAGILRDAGVMGKEAKAESGKGILANHPHLKQGVESFKRVLRLSSGSPSNERALSKSPIPTNGSLTQTDQEKPKDV